MSGVGPKGELRLPTVTDAELDEWVGRVREAIRTTPYGEVKIILSEGRMVELVTTSKYRPPAKRA